MVGTKAHRMHRKEAVAAKFRPGRRCWRVYWRIQKLLFELGLEYEVRGK